MNLDEIIAGCQLGDFKYFEELYKIYYRKAFGTAYNICNSKATAEDIVQEAFIICYKSINKLRDPLSFNTWFFRVVVRLSWRMIKKQKNPACTCSDLIENCSSNLTDSAEDICDKLLISQKVKALKLPLKIVLILYYYNNMSVKEISKVLGCFEGTVKFRLYKAREILRSELSPYYSVSHRIFDLNHLEVN